MWGKAIICAAILVIVLSGCPQAPDTQTPAPAPTPSPDPTPAPQPPTPIPKGILVDEIPAGADIIFTSIRHALNELECLDESYEVNVRRSIESKAGQRQQRRLGQKEEKFHDPYPDSDDTFAYIAGYTSLGFPYGVTWEEIGEEPPWFDAEDIEQGGLTRWDKLSGLTFV